MRARMFDLVVLALLILNLFATLNLWFEVRDIKNFLNLPSNFNFNLPSPLWIFGLLTLAAFLSLLKFRKKKSS